MASSADDVSLGGYKIPALTSKENYRSWRINMKDTLRVLDLLPYIEKSLNDLIAANQSDEAKIRKADSKALFQMRVQCDPFVQTFIESVDTAKEIWDTLWNECEDSGSIAHIYLQQQNYSENVGRR